MSAKGRYMFVAHGKLELTNEAIYNWVSNIALKQLKIIRNPITVHRPYSSSMFNCVKYLLNYESLINDYYVLLVRLEAHLLHPGEVSRHSGCPRLTLK